MAEARRRGVTIEEVGNAAAFLCSDLATGITGETLYVDAGFNIVGMAFPEADAPQSAADRTAAAASRIRPAICIQGNQGIRTGRLATS